MQLWDSKIFFFFLSHDFHKNSTTVFNIDTNKKCLLSTKSANSNYFWIWQWRQI